MFGPRAGSVAELIGLRGGHGVATTADPPVAHSRNPFLARLLEHRSELCRGLRKSRRRVGQAQEVLQNEHLPVALQSRADADQWNARALHDPVRDLIRHRLDQQQRLGRTLDGLIAKQHKREVLALHRNAQRLLKPLAVVNPYADRLTFLDDRTRTRKVLEPFAVVPGTPTVDDATPARRRHLYARYTAALTEFWRCRRACAAVSASIASGRSPRIACTHAQWNAV